jgi:hypothetical protein
MQMKFFPSDVIGKKPTKVGDTFKAEVFGSQSTFRVEYFNDAFYMAGATN